MQKQITTEKLSIRSFPTHNSIKGWYKHKKQHVQIPETQEMSIVNFLKSEKFFSFVSTITLLPIPAVQD